MNVSTTFNGVTLKSSAFNRLTLNIRRNYWFKNFQLIKRAVPCRLFNQFRWRTFLLYDSQLTLNEFSLPFSTGHLGVFISVGLTNEKTKKWTKFSEFDAFWIFLWDSVRVVTTICCALVHFVFEFVSEEGWKVFFFDLASVETNWMWKQMLWQSPMKRNIITTRTSCTHDTNKQPLTGLSHVAQ